MLRKVVTTSAIGGCAYLLATLVLDSLAAQLIVAAGVGAVSLMVQFLIGFERRLAAVEDGQHGQTATLQRAVHQGFAKVSAATQLMARLEAAESKNNAIGRLVGQAAAIEPGASPLLVKFVETEMNRMTEFLHSVEHQELTYDGEDREWLLGLTRNATTSIDAISLCTVDADKPGFWAQPLGLDYLSAQQAAIQRGVRIRRLFAVQGPEHVDDRSLWTVYESQASVGIEVRVLNVSDMPLADFVIFDDVVSYEVVSGPPVEGIDPVILCTRLVFRPDHVSRQMDRFRDFWQRARPYGQSLDLNDS